MLGVLVRAHVLRGGRHILSAVKMTVEQSSLQQQITQVLSLSITYIINTPISRSIQPLPIYAIQ